MEDSADVVALRSAIWQPAAMRVFVTGASGFVGRRLMRFFREAGHDAHGADREVDVTNPTVIRGALERHAPEAIVHLAALSSVATSWREPHLCYRLNFVEPAHSWRQRIARAPRHACS